MSPGFDTRLLAVLGPPWVDRDFVEAGRAAETGGATAVQVRLNSATATELLLIVENLVEGLSVPVYVNNRVDVALAGRAVGVHLGAGDLDPRRVRAIVPSEFQIGVSVGDSAEAEAVSGANVDYWSVGSVYATSTKRDAGNPVGPRGFRNLAGLAPEGMPVIAIGGIDTSNVAEILAAGADGVAAGRAIFGVGNVERAARKLRDVIDATFSR